MRVRAKSSTPLRRILGKKSQVKVTFFGIFYINKIFSCNIVNDFRIANQQITAYSKINCHNLDVAEEKVFRILTFTILQVTNFTRKQISDKLFPSKFYKLRPSKHPYNWRKHENYDKINTYMTDSSMISISISPHKQQNAPNSAFNLADLVTGTKLLKTFS